MRAERPEPGIKLPEAIQIRPLTVPVNATISVPGSKSITNRALILAALGKGTTTLEGALWAEDTELMVEALRKLGFQIRVETDPSNECNRTIHVEGQDGRIPAEEADLFVGTAGTAARFLAALCALGHGRYRIHGSERMHQRPMKEVFEAIRKLGGTVEDTHGHLPAVISGPIHAGHLMVDNSESSQFASALLLISKTAILQIQCPSSPYVQMTCHLMEYWNNIQGTFEIEPDASSASYFIALHRLLQKSATPPGEGRLELPHWFPEQSSQIDRFIDNESLWAELWNETAEAELEVSRKTDIGDASMTLAVSAAAWNRRLRLKEAANMRKQECDRLAALKMELRKCGVDADDPDDELVLGPTKQFQPARIQTYNDHRMAMCFAVLGSVDVMKDGKPWITIENPSCVSKTFPNFWETLESLARQSYEAAKVKYRPMVLNADGTPLFTFQ